MELRTPTEIDAEAPTLSVGELAREYHAALLRFLRRRLRSSDEAADAAQEAYVRMLQYEGATHVRSPYSMLLRIAMNVVHDSHRLGHSRREHAHESLEDMELPSGAPTPEVEAAAADELSRTLEAIDRLPARRREVFLLHRRHNLSYVEIAERCGISVKMVEKHISLALAYCTEQVWGRDA